MFLSENNFVKKKISFLTKKETQGWKSIYKYVNESDNGIPIPTIIHKYVTTKATIKMKYIKHDRSIETDDLRIRVLNVIEINLSI